MRYAIRKNGKYLSGMCCEPPLFEAYQPDHNSYRYDLKQTAEDIARRLNAEVVPVLPTNRCSK